VARDKADPATVRGVGKEAPVGPRGLRVAQGNVDSHVCDDAADIESGTERRRACGGGDRRLQGLDRVEKRTVGIDTLVLNLEPGILEQGVTTSTQRFFF
jgi:hypothetical protein